MTERTEKRGTLIEGVRELIRLEDDGDRIASLISHANWDKYDHREIDLFERARRVFDNVTSQLREQLSQAKIKGEGFHEDTGHRGPITDFEWKSRFINFWKSALLNQPHQNRKQYPCISAVEISIDDLLRVFSEKKLADVIRKEAQQHGPLSQAKAFQIARKAGATESREEIRKVLKTVQGKQRPGPKGSRKNRAVPPA